MLREFLQLPISISAEHSFMSRSCKRPRAIGLTGRQGPRDTTDAFALSVISLHLSVHHEVQSDISVKSQTKNLKLTSAEYS